MNCKAAWTCGADEAPARLQCVGVDAANHRQRIVRLVERRGALARVQRQHHPAIRVQLIDRQLEPAARRAAGAR